MNREIILKGLGNIASDNWIVIEDVNDQIEKFRENNKDVYLATLHLCETSIARRLRTLISAPKSIRKIDTEKAIEWLQKQLPMTLATRQIGAVTCALEEKVMVITGGPGTGKTTIINAILKIFTKVTDNVMLAAPTGRAAKRMNEATGHPARTIHRMLEYSLRKGGFQKNEEHPLTCDLLIVDEASMIDTVLLHYLLKAIPPRATLVSGGGYSSAPICRSRKRSQGHHRLGGCARRRAA